MCQNCPWVHYCLLRYRKDGKITNTQQCTIIANRLTSFCQKYVVQFFLMTRYYTLVMLGGVQSHKQGFSWSAVLKLHCWMRS